MASAATVRRRSGTWRWGTWRWGTWRWGVAATLLGAQPAGAADQAQVQLAIDHARDYLFQAQRDGNWEVVQAPPTPADPNEQFSVRDGQWGGMTAIATLALLAAGVDAGDPHVTSAVAFLRRAELRGNYALGLRAQVWNLIPPQPWVRQAEVADLKQLGRGIRTAPGDPQGFYGYSTVYPPPLAVPGVPPAPAGPAPTDYDHSVSQFAVLGMWSLAQAGVEVPTKYWQLVDTSWRHQQLPAGAWSYYARPDPKIVADATPTVQMTAAGVATLFITQEMLSTQARCAGNPDDPAIDAGLKYLGDHLDTVGPPRRFYTLFAVSRVGLASGYKYLGSTDWFQWGADLILHDPKAASWATTHGTEDVNGVADTAFALLFLSRGRAPVLMNKLRYDVPAAAAAPSARPAKPTAAAAWNQRPRDVANLARWVGRQIESPLNWQVVDLRAADADLHDAPILYVAGGRAPRLSVADGAKVRAYCEDGGLVLGHADCGSADFAAGFRQLGERLFPGRRFRTLEPTSPIYTDQTFAAAQWRSGRPAVEALSNGTRELMVLLPAGDPARTWQSQSFQSAKRETYGQLMVDLFLYAVDKQGLRRRGETYLVARNGSAPAAGRSVKVARVRYAGNWDPEPGGWRRLANVMHNAGSAELTVEPVDGPIDKSYALASLTVAAADAKLTDAQRSALRDYVKGGGTLLVDVAGGRSLYRAAAEAELAQLFPDAPRPLPVLPPDAPVYAAAPGRPALTSVDYRRFQRVGNGHAPLLRGHAVGGRAAVLYSPEDLSTGLVGEPVDGVTGYAPPSAAAVVGHVLLYAAH